MLSDMTVLYLLLLLLKYIYIYCISLFIYNGHYLLNILYNFNNNVYMISL